MNSLMTLIDTPAVPALAWTLTHFLWQGTALALVSYLLVRALEPSATSRYAIGVLTLVAMFVTPIATFSFLVGTAHTPATTMSLQPKSAESVAALAVLPAPEPASVPVADQVPATAAAPVTLAPIVTGLWFVGVVALSMRLFGGWFVARRMARRAVRPVTPEIETLARRVAGRLALDRVVAVFESSAVTVPILVGWVRPVVLLPAAAMAGLTVTQVEALLAHELAHVRRHDYLVNLLQSAVETLLFYHPAVWWVSRQVRAEREHCCDDLAVGVCDRVVYATALADLAAMSLVPRTALAATDGSLLARVRRILGGSGDAHKPASAWLPVSVIALVASALVPVALASAGQQPPPDPPKVVTVKKVQKVEPVKVTVAPKVRKVDIVKVAVAAAAPEVRKVDQVTVAVVPTVQKVDIVKVAVAVPTVDRIDITKVVGGAGQVVVAPKVVATPDAQAGWVRVVAPEPAIAGGIVVAPRVDAPDPEADQRRTITVEERRRLEAELERLADQLRDNVDIEEIEQRLRALAERLRAQAGRTEAALHELQARQAELQQALAADRTPELEQRAAQVAAEMQAVRANFDRQQVQTEVIARLREAEFGEQAALMAAEAAKLREINVEEFAAQAAKLAEMREVDVERLALEAQKLQQVHELQALEMALEAQKLQEVQEIAAVRATEEVSRIRDMRAALADERARVASRAGASFDGTGSFSWTADGQQTDVTWTGAFRVSGDGRDVATIEPGASVRLSDGPWALSTGVEVSALADGSLEHTFFVNGQEQPYDTDARDFLAEMLSRVVRWGGAQLR